MQLNANDKAESHGSALRDGFIYYYYYFSPPHLIELLDLGRGVWSMRRKKRRYCVGKGYAWLVGETTA